MSFLFVWWPSLPSFLKVFFLAMLPVTELRASIPVGILVYKMEPWSTFLWSVSGDIIPAFFIYWFLKLLVGRLMRESSFLNKIFSWWFAQVNRRYQKGYQRWGILALILFISIPLPGTGVWTGVTAAYIFSLPFKKSLLAAATGAILAGILVTLATLGIFNAFNLV